MAGLSPKQRKFVAEYLKDPTGTRAAIAAGYSPNGAEVTASKLLRVPKVRDAVEKGLRKLEITSEYVLGGIRRVSAEGLEEHNRLKAFELLGKYLKLFVDKVEHSGAVSIAVIDPYAEPKK